MKATDSQQPNFTAQTVQASRFKANPLDADAQQGSPAGDLLTHDQVTLDGQGGWKWKPSVTIMCG
ncbi:MAG: hypothetical protein ACYCW6_10165 [Candidatus Xenobia bacterium]